MTDAVQVALISGSFTLAGFIVSRLWGSFENRQTAKKVEEVHIATNSMKDALVKATGDARFLAGLAQGAAMEKAEASKLAMSKSEGIAEGKKGTTDEQRE